MPSTLKFLVCATYLIAALAVAQGPTLPTGADTTKMLETIRKNAADFDNDDSEIRRRAVLVLGKYKNQMDAKRVLLQALDDTDARVRQAALVTLVDGIADGPTSRKVVGLLTDESVSVRRICSAALPRLLLSIRVSVPTTGGPPRPIYSKELIMTIRQAHADTDPTVRKNLVATWGQVPGTVTADVVRTYLKDTNRDVRISALDKGRFAIPAREYLKSARAMVGDPDREVRLRLARILGSYSSFGDQKPLETLSKDKDALVRATALMSLMSAGRGDAWEALKKEIAERRVQSTDAVAALELLPRLGEVGINELKGFLKSEDAAFRAAALQSLGRYQPQAISDTAVLDALKDPSSDVRTKAGRLLMRRPKLGGDSLKALATNHHQDVRLLALSFVGMGSRKEAEAILMDLFLDESTTIRQAALRRIGRMRLNGWRQLMIDALEDNEGAVREQAVSSLIEAASFPAKADDPYLAPLKAYLTTGKDEKLKAIIRSKVAIFMPRLPRK